MCREGTADRVAKLGKGITSITFAGKNKRGGDDLYVVAARKYLSFENGDLLKKTKSSPLYKISSEKMGISYNRLTVKK